MYADIIVDISHEKLDRPFQYLVSASLETVLEEGMCVKIPFGKGNRLIQGYVIELTMQCKFDPLKMKEIHSVVESSAGVEASMIRLAAWIRKNYGSTMIQALKTVLPAKKTVRQLEHRTIERIADRETLIAALGEAGRKKQAARERLLTQLLEKSTDMPRDEYISMNHELSGLFDQYDCYKRYLVSVFYHFSSNRR